jgi:protocatechuate 3,4-dioxygenase alpha subunit
VPGQTPSQTVGPFFAYGLVPEAYGRTGLATGRLAGDEVPGERVVIVGNVLDGAGQAVPDALLEVWQADAQGRYAQAAHGSNSGFNGFGRVATDAAGGFRLETIKPGRVAGPDGTLQAPHLGVIVFCRGLLSHAFTRIYFADEAANADDPVLALVEAERRATLMAEPRGTGHYTWNVVLQGDDETVFFDA